MNSPFDRRVVDATVSGDQYVYNQFDPDDISTVSDGLRSRWAIQLGARLSF